MREAYAGRTVLLTGVTGFVGSLVLEQLLRTCPEIARVYVVVRQKHGISGRARFHKMLHTNPLFHLLRDTLLLPCFAGSAGHDALLFEDASSDDGNRESIGCKTPQIEAIAGNMTLPDYGIAQADLLRLQQQTEIVIHAAASISFDDHIHDAITHNYMVRCSQCPQHDMDNCMHDRLLESETHIFAPFVHPFVPRKLFKADAKYCLRIKCNHGFASCDASDLLKMSAGNQIHSRHGVTYAQSEGFRACFYGLREWQPVKGERNFRSHATPD